VVRPDDTGDEVKYQVAFATREGVPVFGPELPSPALFNRDSSFRDFLLTKRKKKKELGIILCLITFFSGQRRANGARTLACVREAT
jgi:hypothetical protein